MNPEDSLLIFQDRVTRAGLSLEKLIPAETLAQMMAFYREVRAERCHLDEEGDMLHFEWGSFDWGQGETFHVEFTRQFILPGNEDEDGMSQLFVRLHYPATVGLRALGEGSQWCESPDVAAAFEESVLASPAYRAVVTQPSDAITMEWTPL